MFLTFLIKSCGERLFELYLTSQENDKSSDISDTGVKR